MIGNQPGRSAQIGVEAAPGRGPDLAQERLAIRDAGRPAGRRHGGRQDDPGARLPGLAARATLAGTETRAGRAPSKLLEEWQDQIATHIGGAGIGAPALAYGA